MIPGKNSDNVYFDQQNYLLLDNPIAIARTTNPITKNTQLLWKVLRKGNS